MKRPLMLLCSVAVLTLGVGMAQAETAQERIVRGLVEDGYSTVHTRRTLLGRVRITAEGPAGSREIVLNPSSGAVLRDYFDAADDDDDEDFDAGDDADDFGNDGVDGDDDHDEHDDDHGDDDRDDNDRDDDGDGGGDSDGDGGDGGGDDD